MKTVTVEVEDLVYAFYEKVSRQANIPIEQIMSNALYTLAGELSRRVVQGEMRWGPQE